MEQIGWVIVRISSNKKLFYWTSTFCTKRSDCINKFVSGTKLTWDQCKRQYNYRCIKAVMKIESFEQEDILLEKYSSK